MPLVRIMSVSVCRLLLLALVSSGAVWSHGVLLASPAAAQTTVIREIQVYGNRRVEPETVRSYLKFSVGDAYDAERANSSIKALFATGLFADVRIDRSGSDVIVEVVENPVINQVAFEGNSEIDTETLRGEVQLKPRSVFTRARVQADSQRILDVYRRQGRYAAVVEPKIIELEQDRVNLVFEISEGAATKVKGINFVGNKAFTDTELRDVISTTEKGWLDFLKGTSVYDPDRMNLDRELVRQHYLKNGYPDTQVVAANAELDRDGSGFFITFAIDEGERYEFGTTKVESRVSDIDAAAYESKMLTDSGDEYDASKVDKSVDELTESVTKDGYAFARVRPNPQADPINHKMDITYVIEEGPRLYIDRINIVGNTRTKDYVIRREFRLAEGDAYNPALVEGAKKRLKGLGLFKTVEVKRRPGTAQDRVVLDVEIEEQSTGELSFGAGYSTAEGVIGDISITERNLMGNGQFLRLSLSGSLERMQVDLSFTEPRFLDRNLAAGFDIYHKEVSYQSESGFDSRNTGLGLRLGFPVSENVWMQTSYNLSRDEIYDVSPGASPAIQESEGTFYTSMIGTTVTYDQRNDPRNPTEGLWFQGGTSFAGLGGDVQYVRFSAEGRGYFPITDNITFVGRAVGGHILGWGGEDVRLLDLYFRGGETVRGFDRAGFGPRDLRTGDALGGATYWATTAELRFPIPLIPEDLGISGAVFADAGSLWQAGAASEAALADCPPVNGEACLADSGSIRSSVGASILWTSPVGPIRMDFAKVLTAESYDEEQMFRFGAATKF